MLILILILFIRIVNIVIHRNYCLSFAHIYFILFSYFYYLSSTSLFVFTTSNSFLSYTSSSSYSSTSIFSFFPFSSFSPFFPFPQELKHLNLSVYKRIGNLLKDDSRSYIFYPNECSSETAVLR
jgi:hypothetical protein